MDPSARSWSKYRILKKKVSSKEFNTKPLVQGVWGGWFGYLNVLSGGWYVEEHPVCIELTVFCQFVYKMCLGLFLQALWLEQTVNMTYHIYLSHSTTDQSLLEQMINYSIWANWAIDSLLLSS